MVKKVPLQSRPNAVSFVMRADPYRIGRCLADAECDLRDKKDALMEELMRRALAQNPDLAKELREVEEQSETVKSIRVAERVKKFKEWEAKRQEEHIATRKIRYDDKRNYNKLNAIRRDPYYKSLSRLEQIEYEIAEYWGPYNLPLPQELEDERNNLLSQDSLRAG